MLSRKLLIPLGDPLVATSVSLISHSHTTHTGAIPSHTTGDILIGFATCFDPFSPAQPAGWNSIISSVTNSGGVSIGRKVSYKVAASSSESATWGSDTDILSYVVLRGQSGIGTSTRSVASDLTNNALPTIGLDVVDGSSFIVTVLHANGTGKTLSGVPPFYTQHSSAEVGGATGTLLTRAGGTRVADADVSYTPAESVEYQGIFVEVLS